MLKCFLTSMDVSAVNEIRADWIEQIEEGDESGLELTDSFFDHLMSSDNFGDLLKRSNETTYMSVRKEDDPEEVVAIAVIIFVRQGAKSICKIMDINHSPAINNLGDDDYKKASYSVLATVLSYMLSINKTTKHGITKIYARDDAAQSTMKLMQEMLDKSVFEEIGFQVKFLNRHWLEFVKI